MSDERLAGIMRDLHAGRLPNHDVRQALIREVTRLRRSSSETAQLGSALVDALREVPLGRALAIDPHDGQSVWIISASSNDLSEADATRRLSAALAAFPQEDSRG